MYKLNLGKAEEPEFKFPTPNWIVEKAIEFQEKKIYFCFIDFAKLFYCGHNKLWTILKKMGTPEHLTCLLRNLYADQEAAIGTGHGTKDWFKIGK